MADDDFQRLRTLKEACSARLAQMEYEKRVGELSERAAEEDWLQARMSSLIRNVLAVTEKMKDALAAERDSRNCEEILEAALREALTSGYENE